MKGYKIYARTQFGYREGVTWATTRFEAERCKVRFEEDGYDSVEITEEDDGLMVRCPECVRENAASYVVKNCCAWCGHKGKE